MIALLKAWIASVCWSFWFLFWLPPPLPIFTIIIEVRGKNEKTSFSSEQYLNLQRPHFGAHQPLTASSTWVGGKMLERFPTLLVSFLVMSLTIKSSSCKNWKSKLSVIILMLATSSILNAWRPWKHFLWPSLDWQNSMSWDFVGSVVNHTIR